MKLIIHDLNPQVLSLETMVRRLSPDTFVGNISFSNAKILQQARLRELVEEVDESIIIATNAIPLYTGTWTLATSLTTVAHPIARVESIYRSKCLIRERTGQPFLTLEDEVVAHFEQSPNNMLVNFQTSIMLGGVWKKQMAFSVGNLLGSRLVNASVVALADYSSLTRIILIRHLIDAGVALPDRLLWVIDLETTVAQRVETVRESLSPSVFRRLIERNQADLGLFEAVAEAMINAAPVSEPKKRTAFDVLSKISDLLACPGDRSPGAKHADDAGTITYRKDPDLGWWPVPRSLIRLHILGRDISMQTDSHGYRIVSRQPRLAERTLAVYGCSLVFGWGLSEDETMCSRLQEALPQWRIENRGMNGFGTIHNLIQLERASLFEPAEAVTFCWIPMHLKRSVAHPWVIQRYQSPNWMTSPITHHAKAYLKENGEIAARTVSFKRPDLSGVDLEDFYPDSYYMILVAFKLFQRAREIVASTGGHFFVTVLNGEMPPVLANMLGKADIAIVDASLHGEPRYTLLPDDEHPNEAANLFFGERILAHLSAVFGTGIICTREQELP